MHRIAKSSRLCKRFTRVACKLLHLFRCEEEVVTMKPDQLRVHSLLKDTVTLLCKNGLNFRNVLSIQGVIGITVDDVDVFLVHINDVFSNEDDSAGDEQIAAPKSPQRTADTEFCTKSIKGQFRSSSTEQKKCIQRHIEEDTVDNDQPPDNSLLFAVPQASKADDSSYFNPSANDAAAPSNNSGSFFDFNQAKIEPKHEDCDDDDVVFLSPEDLPLDGFSQGCYMEQTQTEANSHKWKHDKHQYDVHYRESRKQNPTRRRVVTSVKNSPLNVQEYEQNDLTGFSSQQRHQQTMFQPPNSYTSEDGELSSYLNNSYSMNSGAIDSNNGAGDVGLDLMPVDNSQRSFFGDSNDDASEGNQNFATLDVQQRSHKRMASDQFQQKRKQGRPSQPIERDCWATVTATKFLCKMCGSSFNHRPSLLAHQINKHGRPKNRRGRPPTQLFME